ncbi:MFS transporter, putative [Paecilomyces variotii No. 5]|uniref:MFS transporter, putative n=1 Tax=Byssochlamys spectabilis (strain No. 5 / NBRC 109023) TaxID=1356009 RepID=V5FKI5_BYSSN|nr:MFS transporter, putative [Paecilomyces variotii No. 5]
MATEGTAGGSAPAVPEAAAGREPKRHPTTIRWKSFLKGSKNDTESDSVEAFKGYREKWTLGILNDKETDEVPGTVLLLSSNRNEPLGLRNQPARTSASSIPDPLPPSRSSSRAGASTSNVKKTSDGNIVLDPQPEDSLNDPLNWPQWRRDAALISLGLYCMMGGGMTPILAAGFNEVAATYSVTTQQVAFTTGLYMLGLGLGSVIMSPTAILYGKRPVYLLGITLFIISAVWCALSPNYASLVVARVFQGIAVSPVECLPSATIAEIFFLHERAYRVGIYTLLLLGGKNLVPLVSAAIIQSLGWRWVFWIVAIIVGFFLILLFLFVPETFWDRRPRPRKRTKRPHMYRSVSDLVSHGFRGRHPREKPAIGAATEDGDAAAAPRVRKNVGFAEGEKSEKEEVDDNIIPSINTPAGENAGDDAIEGEVEKSANSSGFLQVPTPSAHPTIQDGSSIDAPSEAGDIEAARARPILSRDASRESTPSNTTFLYTHRLREQPALPFLQTLKPWNGRLVRDRWWRVAVRPFVLFAYPAVLWSTLVYSLSIGWLIVLSESVAHIYQGKEHYNFSPLGTGLVYLSPFIGGVIGTAVAGRVSDVIVRYMTRRNGGIYEPEFRLVMAIPVALTTAAGLMGFGWSAQERDAWIVPTIFFGLISFGCSLGSTTSITFCLDSYRQYAGEALVTLNFNIFHGLVFSLFFVNWLEGDGPRTVFLAIGGIQVACLLTAIPMYIFGKRARMWTVRKKLMESL